MSSIAGKTYANLTATSAKEGKGFRFPPSLKHKIFVFCAAKNLSKRSLNPAKIIELMKYLDWDQDEDIELTEVLAKGLTNFIYRNVHAANLILENALIEQTDTPGKPFAIYTVRYRAYTAHWPEAYITDFSYKPPAGTDLADFRGEGVRLSTITVDSTIEAVVEIKERGEKTQQVEKVECVDRPVEKIVYVDRPVEKIVYVERPVKKVVEKLAELSPQQRQFETFTKAFANQFAQKTNCTPTAALEYMLEDSSAPSVLAAIIKQGAVHQRDKADFAATRSKLESETADLAATRSQLSITRLELEREAANRRAEVSQLKDQARQAINAQRAAEEKLRSQTADRDAQVRDLREQARQAVTAQRAAEEKLRSQTADRDGEVRDLREQPRKAGSNADQARSYAHDRFNEVADLKARMSRAVTPAEASEAKRGEEPRAVDHSSLQNILAEYPPSEQSSPEMTQHSAFPSGGVMSTSHLREIARGFSPARDLAGSTDFPDVVRQFTNSVKPVEEGGEEKKKKVGGKGGSKVQFAATPSRFQTRSKGSAGLLGPLENSRI